MTSEGELKKRILEELKIRKLYSSLDETNKIIDEAKQEFLEELGEVGDVDPETLEEKFWPLFHKWFGDSS